MKTSFKLVLTIVFILCSIKTFSQDTNIIKYLPLKIGNVWVYGGSKTSPTCMASFYQRFHIDSIRILNNCTYFKFNYSIRYTNISGNCNGFYYIADGYYRIDSLSGNFYKYSTNSGCSLTPNDILIDSLSSNVGDTTHLCVPPNQFQMKILRDTISRNVFSISKPTKLFEGGNFFEYGFTARYAKDIGIIEFGEGGMFLFSHSNLLGCIINDTVYGDTNYHFVSLSPISSEIPKAFALSQNYPNPFNPSTMIKFDIPKSSFVKLVIYNSLGKEINTIVNVQLNAGTYSVDWDASSFPSGVYFYKLTAGEYGETRKMVLIK